jgi:hypothetical protein
MGPGRHVGFPITTMIRLSLTLNPMGISHFHLFFRNHKTDLNQTWQRKKDENVKFP